MADVMCFDDLDEFGRDIDDPLVELEQDIVHTILEAYGTNPDAPTRSIGLEDALSGPANSGLRHLIETKLAEDDRIGAVEAVLTANDANGIHIALRIQCSDDVLVMAFDADAGGVRRSA